MADNNNNGNLVIGVVVVLVLLYLVMRPGRGYGYGMHCGACHRMPCACNESMDIMADKPLDLDYGLRDEDEMSAAVAGDNELGMGVNDLGQNETGNMDTFYDASKMMPQLGKVGQPDWTKTFENADNMLLQQNFIDTTDTERFQVTRSVCGRRFMSRDLRRVPTVTRDPRTVSSFQLPYINPQCALEYNSLHPGLD